MLYCHLHHHNDTIIKMQEDFFNKIYVPLTLLQGFKKVTQGLRVRGSWRPNRNFNILTPTLMAVNVVFFVHLMLNWRPWGPLCWVMAFFTASYQQLLWSPGSIGVPEGPFGRMWFYVHLVPLPLQLYCNSNSTASVLTELYNSSTPTRSLKSHVWLSSSGNNCHAVHRSLSSGVSVYECTIGIFLACPISSANFRPRDFLSYLPLECVTSCRCITLEWHFWLGRRSKYNNKLLFKFVDMIKNIRSDSSNS